MIDIMYTHSISIMYPMIKTMYPHIVNIMYLLNPNPKHNVLISLDTM